MDSEAEERLPGGKLTVVVRVGDTVRRPSRSWTPAIHELLTHLQTKGFEFSPRPLGYDEQGREILSCIAGDTSGSVKPWPGTLWSDELLVDVAKAAARYHQAVIDFAPSEPAHWQFRSRPLQPGEIIIHNDLAPYNVVVQGSRLKGIIDWDCACPGTVREELAFMAWQWVPLLPPDIATKLGCEPQLDQVNRLRLLLDSYGYERREGFLGEVLKQIEITRSSIEKRADAGEPEFRALIDEGHTQDMAETIEYLRNTGDRFQAAID